MRHVWMSGAVMSLMSLGLAACGGKQTAAETALEAQGSVGATYAGTVETQRVESVLRARDLVNMGQGGHYEREPSFRFRVTQETELEVAASSDQADLMLIVSGPGLPYMNDDNYGLNPAVKTRFTPGVYSVHVGTWQGSDADIPYTLHLRSADAEPMDESWAGGHPATEGNGAPEAEAMLNAAPALGTFVLGQISEERQRTAQLVPQNRSTGDCYGIFALDRPIAELDPRQLGDDGVRVILSGKAANGSNVDTVLYGIDEQGNEICSDDFAGLDAGFELMGGDHAPITIFAGSWDGSGGGNATTFELKFVDVPARNYEFDTVESRFRGEPLFAAVKGYNRDSISGLGPECVGYVRDAEKPDWSVRVARGAGSLVFRAQGSGDPVMAVQTPSGEFYCNDDGVDLNSVVLIPRADAGEYKVWAGSWTENEQVSTVLSLRASTPMNAPSGGVVGVEDFQEHQLRVTAQSPRAVLGDAQFCEGNAVGYIDTERPSAVFENTTSGNLYLFVRSTADFDTAMIARSSAGFLECTDDDVNYDALSVIQLAPGEQAYIWAGSYNEADARKEITLRYAFLNEEAESAQEIAEGFFR